MSGSHLILRMVMAFLILGAFAVFFRKAHRLWRIMHAVEGDGPPPPGEWAKRFSLLFTDILGQANVRRKPGIGLAHMAIFFGFLAVQPHSLCTMISLVFPSFSMTAFFPRLWSGYLFAADILAFCALVGLLYAAYRRLSVRPPYLPPTMDALYIILFTASVILTFQMLNGVEAMLPGAPVSPWDTPFSGLLALLLGLKFWSPGALHALGAAMSYIHVLLILGFLVYIPGSKHLHLLAAAPNVLLKPLRVQKAIAPTDIEAEDAESFGLGTVRALSWKNVLDLYACTECGRCHEQCPAAATEKPLSPRDMIHAVKAALFHDAPALLAPSEEAALTPLVGENGALTPDQLWSCTTCRACENICPVNIQHLDLIIEARKHQVLMESRFPQELTATFTNLENQSNPWGLPVTARTEWHAGLDLLPPERAAEAEIVYCPGSGLSLDDRGRHVSRALIRALNTAGVTVAVLGAEELDTGDDARRAGNEYLAQALIKANIEALQGRGVTRILTACPHTFNSLRNEYPQFGGRFTVHHHTEYLLGLIRAGRLAPHRDVPLRLTFHDSCYLGRWNGIYDAPRQLIALCNGGVPPLEPARCRDKSFCCGGGGARMFMEEHLGSRINVARCRELQATGADVVAAACPYCLTMLTDGVKETGWNARVADPAELLAECLE